jgi:hypothetical protein
MIQNVAPIGGIDATYLLDEFLPYGGLHQAAEPKLA